MWKLGLKEFELLREKERTGGRINRERVVVRDLEGKPFDLGHVPKFRIDGEA